jgi:hypothetical protein
VLTAGGEELIAAARHIDDTVTSLQRTLQDRIFDFPAQFASPPPSKSSSLALCS